MQLFTYVLLGIFAVAFTVAAPMEGKVDEPNKGDAPFKLSDTQAPPLVPRGNVNGSVSGNSGGGVIGVGIISGGGGAGGGVGGNSGAVNKVSGKGASVRNGGGGGSRNSGKISGGNVRIGRVG
ncbi:hypothetical protein ONZ45_g19123 [Pleurotus djamor]|nr:hypothetical protein ONZ45_g19123 [Pleurotus djamor]